MPDLLEGAQDPDPAGSSVVAPLPSSSTPTEASHAGEDQALESHEVIELQTFSERKAWIEEKIKFLESLPPIEVFTGLEAIRASAEDVPGLPTRTELEQWVLEHDVIEKETEIFDTGELTKLRQLTKAATQRNLSPADTDVIELTLTTIYALDKLLHLLRDRSESLDMMSIRLTWEENRRSGWKERHQIIEDLNQFSITRARWNASAYNALPISDSQPNPSQVFSASQSSFSDLESPAFSRSARFKLAELLSRDAAQFSGKITALKHGTVSAAGKALDRLIDQSRKPVPEVLLDEQDQLEEKCINQMENIDRFTMNLVMQWRKADEIYVETMKDRTTACNLIEEIDLAKQSHPTARQSALFISRVDTILKRLAVRGDPASSANLFPMPEHFLFPEQNSANTALVQGLSEEIRSVNILANKVDKAAKEYRIISDSVKRVETLVESMNESSTNLNAILKRFKEGTSSSDSHGSPPDLSSERCIDPSTYSLYLALYPTLLKDAEVALSLSDRQLRDAPSALLYLTSPGIDKEFKDRAAAVVHNLDLLRQEVLKTRELATNMVDTLWESRKISLDIDSKLSSLHRVKMQIYNDAEKNRWRKGGEDVESALNTSSQPTTESFENQLLQLRSKIKPDINDSLGNLNIPLGGSLQVYLHEKTSSLHNSLDDGFQMLKVLGAVREQTLAMNSVKSSFNKIARHAEDRKSAIIASIENVMNPKEMHSDMSITDAVDLGPIQSQVNDFNNGLVTRVPFVAPQSSLRLAAAPQNISHMATMAQPLLELSANSFDLASYDAAVRADSNAFSMRLNGYMETLSKLTLHFELAHMSKEVDFALTRSVEEIDRVIQEVLGHKQNLKDIIADIESLPIGQLEAVFSGIQVSKAKSPEISSSFSPIGHLLRQMDEKSQHLELSIRESLYISKDNIMKVAQQKLEQWTEDVDCTLADISNTLDKARQLQAEREQKKLEEERQATAKKIRLENERVELERRKLEEERKIEEERITAERIQLENERIEGERRQLEEQRKMEQERRMAAEAEAERQQLENKRLEVVRQVEELRQIEEERRVAAEAEAERQRLENERLEVERQQIEKLRKMEEERRVAAEAEIVQLEDQRKDEEERRVFAEAEAKRQWLEKERIEADRIEFEERNMKKHSVATAAESKTLGVENEAVETERRHSKVEDDAKESEQNEVHLFGGNTERESIISGSKQFGLSADLQDENAQEAISNDSSKDDQKASSDIPPTLNAPLSENSTAAKEKYDLDLGRPTLALIGTQTIDEIDENDVDVNDLIKNSRPRRSVEDGTKRRKHEIIETDVFGTKVASTRPKARQTRDFRELQSRISTLHKRLNSLGLKEILCPSTASTPLPTPEQYKKLRRDLTAIVTSIKLLPLEVDDNNVSIELTTLRNNKKESLEQLDEIQILVEVFLAVQSCDAALSDLLEHIDSFPAVPLSMLSSSHKSVPGATPEDQLSARLSFTRDITESLAAKVAIIRNDYRVISEHSRIQQTWSELEEMGNDRLCGQKSRPSSAISGLSSGDFSAKSTQSVQSRHSRSSGKMGSYSHLSRSSLSIPAKGKMLAPPPPQFNARRTLSGSNDSSRRSSSRLSISSTNRSVSGPLHSSLFGSTFASRQRTTSLSNPTSPPPRRPSMTSHLRLNSERKGTSSPMSEHSSLSRSSLQPSRSTNSSSWSRAPRLFGPTINVPHNNTTNSARTKYVADPKSKLDVAVGDVVNQLPVGINVEGITESWRDQSGKYWIGNQDPKLCFCRILRSQTVMVRVGGGWTELSKFIKDHFAESFSIAAPESPPRSGQAEKWISSATLLQSREAGTLPSPPHTPEPTVPFLPSLSIVTPGGKSPQSLKSSPSTKGSPLTPLQFIRRAEPDNSMFRPGTPSKTPLRNRTSHSHTPRSAIWRP